METLIEIIAELRAERKTFQEQLDKEIYLKNLWWDKMKELEKELENLKTTENV